jgi:hypothetical protein
MLADAKSHINMFSYTQFGQSRGSTLVQIRENKILTLAVSLVVASFRLNQKISSGSE